MDFDDDIVDNDDNSRLTELPEAKLLLAMLYQTIDDALYVPKRTKENATEKTVTSLKSKNKLALRDKIDAIQWLFDDNDIYDLCCELAGMNKYNIRNMIIEKIGAEQILPLVHKFYQPNGH
jgi:uncharacterized protein YdcH (DUF465 family)